MGGRRHRRHNRKLAAVDDHQQRRRRRARVRRRPFAGPDRRTVLGGPMATTRFKDHLLTGTTAARPAATTVPEGTLYASSSDGVIYQSAAGAWETWLAAATGIPVGVVDAKGDLIAATAA